MADITIVVPTIPPRRKLLQRAIDSCMVQKDSIAAISIAVDQSHEGAWTTRNRALMKVDTTWTGFLDDDDELLPNHVSFLLGKAAEENLDFVWGWFNVIGGTDPFPSHRGKQYDPEVPHIFPITYIARTELILAAARECGGFLPETGHGWTSQDKPIVDAMIRLGAKHKAFSDKTWRWHHHDANTSGLPDRWH